MSGLPVIHISSLTDCHDDGVYEGPCLQVRWLGFMAQIAFGRFEREAPPPAESETPAPTERGEKVLRDPLALAMLGAWLNCPPDKLPAEMRAHTCEATMTAWERVGEAALAYHANNTAVA